MDQTDIRLIQQAYIRAVQELGRLHRELDACGDPHAMLTVRQITSELADQIPHNWTACELTAGYAAIMKDDDRCNLLNEPALMDLGLALMVPRGQA